MTGTSTRERCSAARNVSPRALSDADGSVLPLLAAFTAIALALILVVGAAGSLYLDHKRLLTVADSAALAAAESFELGDTRLGEKGVVPELSSRQARAAAGTALGENPTASEQGMALRDVHVSDGRSATVTVAMVWRPPWVSLFLPDGVPIQATSTARSVFR